MRIGFFTSIDGWGGSEAYLLSLMIGVRDAGHAPVLFGVGGSRLYNESLAAGLQCVMWRETGGRRGAGKGNSQGNSDHSCVLQEKGRTCLELKSLLLKMVPEGIRLVAGNAKEAVFLRRLFREHPVDVMHVNLNGYEVAGLACNLCDIPAVGWHCIMPTPLPWSLRRWLYWWLNRRYAVVGGMSATCVDAWRQYCGLPGSKCRPLWNGIPLAKYLQMPLRSRSPGDPFVALAVGRLHPMKGFDKLIEAFGVVKDPRLKLVIAGEGSGEHDLKSLAADQPGAGNIMFEGHREDVESLYQAAHCLVLPSVSHESFGLVLAEAMASGLPLITSDFGPLPEINVRGETGLVVPAGDVEKLASAIRLLMDDPSLCRALGSAGRARAKEHFSSDDMVKKMIGIYEEVVA